MSIVILLSAQTRYITPVFVETVHENYVSYLSCLQV